MSLSSRRLAATLVALVGVLVAGLAAGAATPDSTWVALPPLPAQGHAPVFALTVDPANNQVLIAGNSQGSILRSANGGSSWTTVSRGTVAITTIAFSPVTAGTVLAGTRGSGALISTDAGVKWTQVTGLDRRDVRVFAFALSVVAAGTDNGVYISPDGVDWKQSGLANTSIEALAVAAIHAPAHLIAGGSTAATAGPPLYESADAGSTWSSVTPALSGTVVSRLAAGPLPPTGNVRPLLAGTNAGLFISSDNAATFNPLSGGDLLPSTDYTQIAFVTTHYDRFYVGSDGGGSRSGGLWSTRDKGQHFTSLVPPLPSISALAVSNDEAPILYVATFRASDHTAALWAYHDTGSSPQGPFTAVTPTASGSRSGKANQGGLAEFLRPLSSSQTPYISLGVVALLLLLLAAISHFRASRR
ncbi:MAG TPA: hypothetical protein VLR46_03360 [Candidatus Dormibacteraeota bacterium]|nr:hypothetical protein [Candidatus Dormibacteraeota bacterium]